jgi:hypothetical protein
VEGTFHFFLPSFGYDPDMAFSLDSGDALECVDDRAEGCATFLSLKIIAILSSLSEIFLINLMQIKANAYFIA